MEQVGDVLNAYNTKGQHVVLFGERGVGKTSIANIIAEALGGMPGASPPTSIRVGCTAGDIYSDIWGTVFRKLGLEHDPEDLVQPEQVRQVLSGLEYPTLIILDEFDRLSDPETGNLLADTIKLLSDEPTPATLLLVGVADSIDDLVEDHKSVARALRQVQIPRMKQRELEEIVSKGAARVGLKISEKHRSRIASLSEGLPHYTHALSLYAVQRAIEEDRDELVDSDIEAAKSIAVRKAQRTIVTVYNKATRSAHQDVLFSKVLLACALARKDELGMFAARDVVTPLNIVSNKRYEIPAFSRHLRLFSSPDRGNILQRHGEERRYFYRFDDPMMQPYIILDGLAKKLISDEVLDRIKETVAGDA